MISRARGISGPNKLKVWNFVELFTSRGLFQGRCKFRGMSSALASVAPVEEQDQDGTEDTIFRYTSGRWLWDEAAQLSRRYVEFNLTELASIAARSTSSSLCVEVKKLTEGNFNKTLLLTMDDGKQVIAKVPNPNAGRIHFTTASEVATMAFVREVLKIPAPKVLAWSSRREQNPVSAEYIIMEKAPGVELEKLWDDLPGRQKYEIVKQLVGFEKSFASTAFTSFGSLYFSRDVPDAARSKVLCTTENGTQIGTSQFAIGPTNNRMYFDDGHGNVGVYRGPWQTAEQYAIDTAHREVACIEELEVFPRPQGLFYGPGQYLPTAASKLSVLNNYLKVAHYLLPKENSLRASTMWHSDLHTNNIFVDPQNPTVILSVIDWQSVHLSPLFLQARHPSLIEFDGPVPDGFGHIELPKNFDQLSPDGQKDAKKLRSAQSLYKLYEVELLQRAKIVYRAIQHREKLTCKITGLIGSIFTDGEPIVNGMLMAVEREWPTIVGLDANGEPLVPCPLAFSAHERSLQSEHEAQWTKGVELMQAVLDELGAYPGWDGWVNQDNYEDMKLRLQKCLENFLAREAKNDADRAGWMEAWPFTDHPNSSKIRRYKAR